MRVRGHCGVLFCQSSSHTHISAALEQPHGPVRVSLKRLTVKAGDWALGSLAVAA